MSKLYASLMAVALLVAATPVSADCMGHTPTQSTQSTPVVTSDAAPAPTTPVPVPVPTTTDTTKTGS